MTLSSRTPRPMVGGMRFRVFDRGYRVSEVIGAASRARGSGRWWRRSALHQGWSVHVERSLMEARPGTSSWRPRASLPLETGFGSNLQPSSNQQAIRRLQPLTSAPIQGVPRAWKRKSLAISIRQRSSNPRSASHLTRQNPFPTTPFLRFYSQVVMASQTRQSQLSKWPLLEP